MFQQEENMMSIMELKVQRSNSNSKEAMHLDKVTVLTNENVRQVGPLVLSKIQLAIFPLDFKLIRWF